MTIPEEGRRVHGDNIIPVDPRLENDIRAVSVAVEKYLGDLSENHRDELRSMLERLDALLEDADAYTRMRGSFSMIRPGPATIGATSQNGMAEAVSGDLFQEQIALVKAAKGVVGKRVSARSLEELRDANDRWVASAGTPIADDKSETS